jgi:hypothetical protein
MDVWDLLKGTAIMPDHHHETHRYPGDPFALFDLSRDMLLAQQKLMPSARMFERFSEAVRSVSQANLNYYQALMRANAIMLGAMLERPSPPTAAHEQRPSVAAKRSEYTQA